MINDEQQHFEFASCQAMRILKKYKFHQFLKPQIGTEACLNKHSAKSCQANSFTCDSPGGLLIGQHL